MALSRRFLSDGGDQLLLTRSSINKELSSHIVIILVSLLFSLICVVALGIVARCALIRRRSSQNSPNLPPKKGLKKKVLQSIPKLSFTPSIHSDQDTGDKTPLECPICLAEFVEGVEIRVLPQCRHVFHVQCVDTWFRSHSSCPFCRKVVEANSDPNWPTPCGPSVSSKDLTVDIERPTRTEGDDERNNSS